MTDAGLVKFTTIFPGCYAGRWPHLHFGGLRLAEGCHSGQASVLTAQPVALPREICAALYASDARFSDSIANLNQLTLQGDNVFGDNSAWQSWPSKPCPCR